MPCIGANSLIYGRPSLLIVRGKTETANPPTLMGRGCCLYKGSPGKMQDGDRLCRGFVSTRHWLDEPPADFLFHCSGLLEQRENVLLALIGLGQHRG